MTEQMKQFVSAKFEIPLWSLAGVLILMLFNIGMTYQQFGDLKVQTVGLSMKFERAVENQQAEALRRQALESRQQATDEKISTLDRRITNLEDFFLRRNMK